MNSSAASALSSVTERLRILQVNTSDSRGGAHRVSYELHRSFRAAGHGSWIAVGIKRTDDRHVLEIPNDAGRSSWAKLCTGAAERVSRGRSGVAADISARALRSLGEPVRWAGWRRGHEDFAFPATSALLDLPPEPVDILHCHNLHGGYFDLRALPTLSQRRPVVLTLHDAWLLSGHCAHSFECDRWESGCGSCPDLEIYPSLRRDATAFNWRRKLDLFSQSSIFLATPCEWLMARVERSLLASAVVEARVIPYGVDRSVFRPGAKEAARATLDIPANAKMLLFSGTGARTSRWRDFEALRQAAAFTADALAPEELILVVLGEEAPDERLGRALIRSMPFRDGSGVALYYQAADLYLQPSRADTFPNVVLEALACGTPVVATAVGGIPEQLSDETGSLVPPGDSRRMAEAAVAFLSDPERLARASRAASEATSLCDLSRHAATYLDWYQEILDRHGSARATKRPSYSATPR
jgi:glycosyltransferase involved in cell wall biosynthesis